MILSWNEIRDRALGFSREWATETREAAEYQSFWNDFFNVFGVNRRSVAVYQQKVKLLKKTIGFIDLFWPGMLVVEHKSASQDLDAAFMQATDYFEGLSEEQKPRYVLVSDYKKFRFYDFEAANEATQKEFSLNELSKNCKLFGFIAGYDMPKNLREEDPVNIKVAYAIGKLHDALKDSGYIGHALEVLLVRLVFCFFADDSGIFERDQLLNYIELKSNYDGSDLGGKLEMVFQTLNTDISKRQTTLDEDLAHFPFVDGGLFKETIPLPSFNSQMRKTLLNCMEFNWSNVSPAIFGSMFQSVMDSKQRHDLGAHYTSEKNILKVINGLFMDEFREEFNRSKTQKKKLILLWKKLSEIKLLDPACGCGNFLVVSYRELRLLEIEIIQALHKEKIDAGQDTMSSANDFTKLDVDMMYGIEIEEFPSLIAQMALWLTDHQMNVKISELIGKVYLRLPLLHSPTIIQGNALQIDWEKIISKNQLTYILGNPPFIGSKVMDDSQHSDLTNLFKDVKSAGELDYVTGWYKKALEYIEGKNIEVAFVSTNSITQGEQVGILWPFLVSRGVKINFAHRTFKWTNEAKGKAAVFCVIIGWSLKDHPRKYIFEYEDVRSEPFITEAKHINAYLIDAPDIFIKSRKKPLSNVPRIGIGNKPIDGGNYLFSTDERDEFVSLEPSAKKYFKRWLGADEFLNGYERWCLWLGDANPEELRKMPKVMERIEAVQRFRLESKSAPTRKIALTPTRFHVENILKSNYLLIPRVSSEKRFYMPMGYIEPDTLTSDSALLIEGASIYHFGILQSHMHMAWMRQVCGRLKSDYRYSAELVYNNFPWPSKVNEIQKKKIADTAQNILEIRLKYPKATLSDLYDPSVMPKELLNAHTNLDFAVDQAYGKTVFTVELERLEFLFKLYQIAIAKEK